MTPNTLNQDAAAGDELAAMETAYTVLAELDPHGRQRGFRWLAEVLGCPDIVFPAPGADVAATTQPAPGATR